MIRAAIPRIQSIKVTRGLEVGGINWLGILQFNKNCSSEPQDKKGRVPADLKVTAEGAGGWRREYFGKSSCGRGGACNIDSAFEISAVFDHDTSRFHVAHQVGSGAQSNAFGRIDISLDGACDDDFLRLHARFNFALGADGQAMIHLKLAAQFSIHDDFFVAGERALDPQGLANYCDAAGASARVASRACRRGSGSSGVAAGGWEEGDGCCSLFHIWVYVSTITANVQRLVEINRARWFLSNSRVSRLCLFSCV